MNAAACLLAGLSLSGQLQAQGTTLPLVGATVSLPTRPGSAAGLTDAAGAILLTGRCGAGGLRILPGMASRWNATVLQKASSASLS